MELDNPDENEDRAKLAVYACLRLVSINHRLSISSGCPLYVDMKNENEHFHYKKFLNLLHDEKIVDLTVLKPYYDYRKN